MFLCVLLYRPFAALLNDSYLCAIFRSTLATLVDGLQ